MTRSNEQKTDRVLEFGEFDDLICLQYGFPAPTSQGCSAYSNIVMGEKLYVVLEFDLNEYVPVAVTVGPQQLLRSAKKS